MADGEVTIDAVLSTDKFEKQIARLQRDTERVERKKIRIQAQIEGLQQQQQQYAELRARAEEYRRKVQEIAFEMNKSKASTLDPGLKTRMEIAQAQYARVKADADSLERVQARLPKQIEELNYKLVESNNKIQEYQNKIKGLNLQRHREDVERLKDDFSNVGNNLQSMILKVGRLALGVIGIRTAMSGLRRLSSELASYDTQYAANLEYIRFALAQAIAPLLRGIVSLAGEVLAIINAIFHLITGRALFGINASGKAFKEMKENTGKVKDNIGGAR